MGLALRRVIHMLSTASHLPMSQVVGARFASGPLQLVPNGHGGKALGSDEVFLFIEGFLLFHDTEICHMLDLGIWIESDCDTCAARRYERQGLPMNVYREKVWRHFQIHRAAQLKNMPDVVRLD